MRSVILWTLAALAGLLVAAGVTLAASSLSRQQIGLSAEPLTAGQGLATRQAARPKATSHAGAPQAGAAHEAPAADPPRHSDTHPRADNRADRGPDRRPRRRQGPRRRRRERRRPRRRQRDD